MPAPPAETLPSDALLCVGVSRPGPSRTRSCPNCGDSPHPACSTHQLAAGRPLPCRCPPHSHTGVWLRPEVLAPQAASAPHTLHVGQEDQRPPSFGVRSLGPERPRRDMKREGAAGRVETEALGAPGWASVCCPLRVPTSTSPSPKAQELGDPPKAAKTPQALGRVSACFPTAPGTPGGQQQPPQRREGWRPGKDGAEEGQCLHLASTVCSSQRFFLGVWKNIFPRKSCREPLVWELTAFGGCRRGGETAGAYGAETVLRPGSPASRGDGPSSNAA